MLSGENGILNQAARAKTETEKGQEQESIGLTGTELGILKYTNQDLTGESVNGYIISSSIYGSTTNRELTTEEIEVLKQEVTNEKLLINPSVTTFCAYQQEYNQPKPYFQIAKENGQSVNVKEVYMPEAKTLSSSAFSGCTSLKTIDLPNLTTIGDSAFSGCSSLESIVIPSTVKNLGVNNTFGGCTSLKSVVIEGTLESFYRTDFTGVPESCVIKYQGKDYTVEELYVEFNS